MKRVVTLCGVIGALAFAGVASAATPQGHLDGDLKFKNPPTLQIHKIDITSTINDGEQVYVAVNNDKSNDCDGDTGTLEVQYDSSTGLGDASGKASYPVLCAHYTGNNSMTISYNDTEIGKFVVIRFVDRSAAGKPDQVLVGSTTDANLAIQWPNRGYGGSGAQLAGLSFDSNNVQSGSATITA